MTTAAVPNALPVIVHRHATRRLDRQLPANMVTALRQMGLQPGREADLYISDQHEYVLPDAAGRTIMLYQIHFKHERPADDLKVFRGLTLKVDSMNPSVITVCNMSFPYDDPLIVRPDVALPAGEDVKYSLCRQGYIARVSAPLGKINVSTHRSIHCANSRFNGGASMLDTFLELAGQHELDLDSLFTTPHARTYCHLFFVAYKDMRLVPLEFETDHLAYLGSFKQQPMNWAALDEEDEVVLEKMVPCNPDLPILERLRPAYYAPEEVPALLAAGFPLVRWESNRPPRRVLPESYQEKERLRGDTPSLEHAWYKLLETGEEARLVEVLTPEQQHLPAEYRARLHHMLDSDPHTHIGPNPPTPGTLIDYLYSHYLIVTKEDAESLRHLDSLPKATNNLILRMLHQRDYWRNCHRQRRDRRGLTDHRAQMLLYLRRQLWKHEPRPRIYTLLTEAKRAAKRAARRAELDAEAAASAEAPAAVTA